MKFYSRFEMQCVELEPALSAPANAEAHQKPWECLLVSLRRHLTEASKRRLWVGHSCCFSPPCRLKSHLWAAEFLRALRNSLGWQRSCCNAAGCSQTPLPPFPICKDKVYGGFRFVQSLQTSPQTSLWVGGCWHGTGCGNAAPSAEGINYKWVLGEREWRGDRRFPPDTYF